MIQKGQTADFSKKNEEIFQNRLAWNKYLLIFAASNEHGSVVQLVRIRACHARGRGFESRPDRK